MRKSQASDSSKPTPKQKPRLAAITAFAQRAGAATFQASFDTVSGRASRKPLMLPPLEVGEAAIAAMLIEMLTLDRGCSLDESRDDLAPALVGEADHRDLRHRRVQ